MWQVATLQYRYRVIEDETVSCKKTVELNFPDPGGVKAVLQQKTILF